MMTNTNDQLNKFKEEIFAKLKENEKKMIDSQIILRSHVDEKMYDFENICNEFKLRVSDIQNITISQKEKSDKVNELMIYKKNSSEQLFTLELKTGKLEKELSSACNKYDRHYLDNLDLTGTIGESCKYKNLKEYLEVIIIWNHFIKFI